MVILKIDLPVVPGTGSHLEFFLISCYDYFMTITQTIEIPANRRITLEVPPQIPAGRTIISFTPIAANKIDAVADIPGKYNKRDLELINLNAEQLNREALDVLSYQKLDL